MSQRRPAAIAGSNLPALRPLALAIHLLALGATLAVVGQPTPALAQAGRSYDIPASALATVLTRFSREAGVYLVGSGSMVEGKNSPGLKGSYGVEAGFAAVLAGTGLEAQRQADGSYGLRAAAKAAPAVGSSVMPEVTVSGKAPGSTTEGTGSYTSFSTSSSTRLNLTPQETPQSVTVLTRQRMDDQKLDNLVDALEATAGIIVQHTTYGQDSPAIYARGSSLNNYQIDGVPVSTSMSPFLSNTAAYDRIEVVRGATGIMNGLGTPAATVNLIRKRPTAQRQASVTAQAGSWNRVGAGFDVSGAVNEEQSIRARLVADGTRRNGWVDRFKQEDLALYGIAEMDLGRDTLLTAGFSHLQQDSNSAIQGRPLLFADGTPTPQSLGDNRSQPWRFYDHSSTGGFTSIEHKFAPGWVGKAEYTNTRYKYDGMVGSIWTGQDASGAGSRIYASHWNSKPEQQSLDAYVTGAFPLFGRSHELIAGVTLSQFEQQGPSYTRDPAYSIFINYHDWVDAPTPAFTATAGSKTRERQDNAFLNTRLSLTDATSVLLGARLTHWQMDVTPATDAAYRQKENVLVPYAGLVHALDDTWSVYASYTKIFRPQDYGILEMNAQQVDPEEGQGFETGVKASFFEGKLNSSLSLYQTKLKNIAVWNAQDFRYDISGLTTTRGVELEGNGELAKGWQLTAGYAFARSEDTAGQRVSNYLPLHSLKVFTAYRLPGDWSRLTLGGGVNWQSATNGDGDSPLNVRQGAVPLVNLMARYEVDQQLSLAFHLNNALDKRYYASGGGAYGTYGPPRNFAVSAKYRF
ncbi:TonB-dependent receptor [Acidovorax sp. CCYZU-2555]|uniref:TonB-dependent siderophore receptor n=1 Tax=Acidovorax sp. CCYZU-2555 TaxID=2835042 RepID=UPI001BD19044|nr:TonB-dependent receptor [Acidovorax sp. CCYZU-2555]MBS7777568.1 TonB-dependent siderophore receptor [Acidovorax sp. CCYZU-2555]